MFRAIGKVIGLLLKTAAKFVGWLLLKLGLFIPALYALTFWLICLFTNTAMTNITLTLFFLGLGLTAAAGLMFAFYRLSRRGKRKTLSTNAVTAAKPLFENKQKGAFRGGFKKTMAENSDNNFEKSDFYASNDDSFADNSLNDSNLYADGEQSEALHAAYRADLNKLHEKYFGEQKRQGNSHENLKTINPQESLSFNGPNHIAAPSNVKMPQENPLANSAKSPYRNLADSAQQTVQERQNVQSDSFGSQKLWERLEGASLPKDEQPLIFKLHGDSSIYVCEYSDRLQYWRRQGQNMTLVKTEFKNERRVK